MSDGIYTHFGRHPLPEKHAQPKPRRKIFFLWGAIAFGAAFMGMALSGFFRRRRKG